MTRVALISSLALAALGFACSSSPTSPNAADSGPAAATFTKVYTGVITGYKCLDCHVPGAIGVTSGGLDMSTKDLAYKNLVNVKAAGSACSTSGLIRVVPGKAEESLIVQKTDSTVAMTKPPCGSQMPLACGKVIINPIDASTETGKPLKCLEDDDLAPLESWINGGALND